MMRDGDLSKDKEEFDFVKHMDAIRQILHGKGYILSTACDYSLTGAMKIGYPNAILIEGTNDDEARQNAQKIVRGKYEQTKIFHDFAFWKDGESLGRIVSPDYEDMNNLPLCDFCHGEGTNRSARFHEHYHQNVHKYSCPQHKPDNAFLEKLATRLQVRVFDLEKRTEIFSNR